VLTLGTMRRSREPELPALGVASALGLAGIDVVYVRRGRIRPIYLADAALESVLIFGWLLALLTGRHRSDRALKA
jgi:hypothetical protein